MTQIPLHNTHAGAPYGVMLKRYRHGTITQNGRLAASVDYAHRDSYYIFVVQEEGENSLLIDFRECKLQGATALCILPGQVHIGVEHNDSVGWLLAVDAMFVNDEAKEIFEKLLFSGNLAALNGDSLADLLSCIELLDRKVCAGIPQPGSSVVPSLTVSFISLVAEIYRNRQPADSDKRAAAITRRFKTLLAERFRTQKMPSQYAGLLNITPAYLNEAVKSVTGFTTGYWIQYEIALEAKRLLFYTDMSVKEIAIHLGYEDHSYFTRLFTQVAGMSPRRFRTAYER
jgi:AraC-like DNA-binding protein